MFYSRDHQPILHILKSFDFFIFNCSKKHFPPYMLSNNHPTKYPPIPKGSFNKFYR